MVIRQKKRARFTSSSLRYYEKHYFFKHGRSVFSSVICLFIHAHQFIPLAMHTHDADRGVFAQILAQMVDIDTQ